MAWNLGLLGAAAGGAAVVYRLQTLGGANNEQGFGVKVDTSGNIATVLGSSSVGAGSTDAVTVYYDSSGVVQWQRVLGGSGGETPQAVDFDSSGNVYMGGFTFTTSTGDGDFLLSKYDTSGTIQWQRILGGGGRTLARDLRIDSSNNLYIAGETQAAGQGGSDFLLAKYNTGGSILWQRTLGLGNVDDAWGLDFDSSGNIYVAGRTASLGIGFDDAVLAKYNSSGTLQWQTYLIDNNANQQARSVAVDSSNNIYVLSAGNFQTTGMLLLKFNSSGTLQWQRNIQNGFGDQGAVRVDQDGNIYLTSRTNALGNNDILIVKYDSSGTIQWQRILGSSNSETVYNNSLSLDAQGNLYVYGETVGGAGGLDALLAVLPNDGSLTGTYVLNGVNITYQAGSVTTGTPTFSTGNPGLTAATSSLTSSGSSLTSASASLTEYRVDL